MNFLEILTLSGSSVGVLIAAHLIARWNSASSIALALYVLSVSLLLLEPLALTRWIPEKIWLVLIGTLTYAIGPSLYLYTRIRMKGRCRRMNVVIHFLPAIILFVLLVLSPAQSSPAANHDDELFLYLFFVLQLISYGVASIRLVWRKSIEEGMAEKMTISFMKTLIYASVALFAFSITCTLLRVNSGVTFVTIVQLLLTIVIVIVALLNTEGLARHRQSEWVEQ